jgi:hypothetical protein
MPVPRQRIVPIELAETSAELDMLLARDVLVAKEQDAVLQKGPIDFAEGRFTQRLGDVDVANFRAERV